jgi:hypothetical protein
MEKEFKYAIVLGLFVLGGVFTGWFISKDVWHKRQLDKTVQDNSGSSTQTDTTQDNSSSSTDTPEEGNPQGVAAYAHLTKTVNNDNTNCTTSPPQHVQAAPLNPPYQSIPRTNPKFCWNKFNYNITTWSFTLKDQYLNTVPNCSTGSVPPTTTSKVCTVMLAANANYYGYLSHVYNGSTYSDNHVYKTP